MIEEVIVISDISDIVGSTLLVIQKIQCDKLKELVICLIPYLIAFVELCIIYKYRRDI